MNYLKKTNWLTLFFVTIICVLTIGNTFALAHLVKAVEAFEPVIIETVPQVETTEETVPETTVETIPEPTECPIKIDCPLDDATQHMIHQKCVEYGVDYPLVMAVIFKESTFRPDVISASGDYGLMQINRLNHQWLSKELGVTNFFDPEQNVTAGIYMLSQLFEKYDYPAKVLMAYNMGEGGASKLWKQGIYSTDYAEDILLQADIYSKQIEERMG